MKLYTDFNSDEAFHIQLINQIILGTAMEQLHEGDSLPSVRQMVDLVSTNMHAVNKAYTILHQEGLIKLDRRRGAVISIDVGRLRVIEEMKQELSTCPARGTCNGVSHSEAYQLVDGLYDAFSKYEAEERVMLCERCKKREAIILYREFGINGERTEFHLCESCARRMNISGDFGDSDDILSLGVMLPAIFMGQSEERKTDYDRVVCPDYKTRYSGFVRDSCFGHPACYEVFDVLMWDNIERLQGSDIHKGKHPKYGLCMRPTAEAQDMAVNEGSEKDVSVSPATLPEVEHRIQVRGLRVKLNMAIRAEDYTKAAEIHDQIRLLEKEDTDA